VSRKLTSSAITNLVDVVFFRQIRDRDFAINFSLLFVVQDLSLPLHNQVPLVEEDELPFSVVCSRFAFDPVKFNHTTRQIVSVRHLEMQQQLVKLVLGPVASIGLLPVPVVDVGGIGTVFHNPARITCKKQSRIFSNCGNRYFPFTPHLHPISPFLKKSWWFLDVGQMLN